MHTIVALIASRGLEDFLSNALISLQRAGVSPHIVHVARPENAAATIDPIVTGAGAWVHPLAEFDPDAGSVAPEHYSEYGSETFIAINWSKVHYLRFLLQQVEHVVYADLDVCWLADPLWYLREIGRDFPLAFQTEAVRRFPPVLCWGFVSAMRSTAADRLFDELLRARSAQPAIDEQAACSALIKADPSWLRQIYPLPEGLFLNGLAYRGLIADTAPQTTLQGALAPFAFHANWTKGLNAKRRLMRQTGTWLVNDQPPPAGRQSIWSWRRLFRVD